MTLIIWWIGKVIWTFMMESLLMLGDVLILISFMGGLSCIQGGAAFLIWIATRKNVSKGFVLAERRGKAVIRISIAWAVFSVMLLRALASASLSKEWMNVAARTQNAALTCSACSPVAPNTTQKGTASSPLTLASARVVTLRTRGETDTGAPQSSTLSMGHTLTI